MFTKLVSTVLSRNNYFASSLAERPLTERFFSFLIVVLPFLFSCQSSICTFLPDHNPTPLDNARFH